MKNQFVCLVGACLVATVAASAQAPAPQSVGLAESLKRAYQGLKNNLQQAAEKMPEADYASKPSSMPEVRTFAALFGHVANAQYGQCSQARAVPNPSQGVNLEEKTAKADVIKALADSFAFCDPLFETLTDQSALEMVPQGRGGMVTRAGAIAGLLSHSNEMYGTAGVYLRAKNIVPPSTENQGRGRGAGAGRGRGN